MKGNAKPVWCVCVCSVVSNSETPQTVACQAPLSMGFPRQECWSRVPFPSSDLSDPGIKPTMLMSPALPVDSLLISQQGSHSIVQTLLFSLDKTFTCTGKPKICVSLFIVIFTLLRWSGTKPTISPNYALYSRILMLVSFLILRKKQKVGLQGPIK